MTGNRNAAVSGHECGDKDISNMDKLKQVYMITGNALVKRWEMIMMT